MYDLITLGDITFDLFFKGEAITEGSDRFNLAIGGKYPADEFHTSVGGGGANVAVGASRHGLSTAVCGRVGENVFKQILVQRLVSRNVSTDLLIFDRDYINLSSILLTRKGERTIIHYAKRTGKFIKNPSIYDKLIKTKFIYMGNLPDLTLNMRYEILKKISRDKVPICLNIGAKDCRLGLEKSKNLIALSRIFTLNTHEFSELLAKPKESIDFKADCRIYLKDSAPTILILTDGEKGSYIYAENFFAHIKPYPVSKVIDCTGAGDGYISAFLASYIKGKSLVDCGQAAGKFAAKIISQLGAQ